MTGSNGHLDRLDAYLDDLLTASVTDAAHDDYLLVRLNDAHAILEVMGKLRTVYPNVLHHERPGLIREGDAEVRADRMRKGELAMFEVAGSRPAACFVPL